MKGTKRKYKSYIIEPHYKQDTNSVDFYEATPSRYEELRAIRKEMIVRDWHGLECECEICTYTEADHAHNRKIKEKADHLKWEIKEATFQKPTLKECKQEIDRRE